MQNTLENRLKFYAQHLGQNIIIGSDCFSSESGNDIIHTTLVSVSLKGIECDGWIPVPEHTALERKPLSSITDEDMTVLSSIIINRVVIPLEIVRSDWGVSVVVNRELSEKMQNLTLEWKVCLDFENSNIRFVIDHITNNGSGIENAECPNILAAYDYLRSKGFATEWMGLSVEQLEEYEWIKILKP